MNTLGCTLGSLLNWPLDTYRYLQDIGPNGGIAFFQQKMQLPDSPGYRTWTRVSVLHRDIFVIADVSYWDKVFGFHKGNEVTGGIELQKLADMAVTSHTPLTCDDKEEHTKIKECCVKANFGPQMVRHSAPEVWKIASKMTQDYAAACEPINISEAIIQFVSRANTLALLAPPGSKAYEKIAPLLIRPDGSANPGWNSIPRAVEDLGSWVRDVIAYSPSYYVEAVSNVLTNFGNPYEPQELAGERGERQVREATEKLIALSREALSLPGEHSTQGQIEMMLQRGEFTQEQIEGMARLIFVVGQRTTSVALEACVRLLILYPEWQEKLAQEIRANLGEEGFDHGILNTMPNLDNFFWEALRLYPPIPFQPREANQDLDLDGTTVPKGATLLMAHYLIQRDPAVYENPDTFNPDRFKDAQKCSKYALRTFGRHPHNCAGRQLAHGLTIKALLVAFLRSYKIVPQDLEKVRQARHMGGFILQFSEPLIATLQPIAK